MSDGVGMLDDTLGQGMTPGGSPLQCTHCRLYVTRLHSLRRLCRVCYASPEVRLMYSVPERYVSQSIRVSGHYLPDPTRHLPGTPGKVDVLAERAAKGQLLWHPLDARHGDEDRGGVLG